QSTTILPKVHSTVFAPLRECAYLGQSCASLVTIFFSFNTTATTEIYTLSLHDALPISEGRGRTSVLQDALGPRAPFRASNQSKRSEEHTSELQSRFDLVCRLLLEKKKKPETSPQVGLTGLPISCSPSKKILVRPLAPTR